MKLPQSITIDFTPVDDGNWYEVEFKADYQCNDSELEQYLSYALEAVRAAKE